MKNTFILLAAVLIIACGQPSNDPAFVVDPARIEGVFTNADALPSSSNFGLYLIDAEGDYKSVVVTIDSVDIHKKGASDEEESKDSGWLVVTEEAQQVDLLKLTGLTSELLGSSKLDAGTYNQIRLNVSKATATLNDDTVLDLKVPSEKIRINVADMVISEDSKFQLVLDFDADKSIVGACTKEANDKKPDELPASGKADKASSCILKPVIQEAGRKDKGKEEMN